MMDTKKTQLNINSLNSNLDRFHLALKALSQLLITLFCLKFT